jgi:hypothetical protein
VSRPDKGRIYVMRPGRMFGGALSFDILDGDTLIGQLAGGGVVSWEREPGQARIQSRENENTAVVDIQVESGNAYYVLQKIQAMGHHSLELVDSDRGKALVKKCKSAQLPVGDANKIREKRDSVVRFYDGDWRRVLAVNLLYGFQKAWLFQFQHEVALSHSTYGSSGLQFGAGFFQTSQSASVRVQDSNGVERSGRFNVNAIPLSVSLFQ